MAEPSKETPFKGSYIKLARARKHLGELETMAAEYMATEPAKVRFDPTPPLGMKTGFQIHFSVKGAPDEMGAVVGDIVHNLRAALDLMATAMVTAAGGSPDDVYFPFCDEEGYLDKMIQKRHFDRAGDAAVRLLKELKPYKGGDTVLRALHDLDIQDKHQTLIVAPLAVGGPILEMHNGDGVPFRDEHGNPQPKLVGDPNKPSSVELQFPVGSALAGKALLQSLKELVQVTTALVERFELLIGPAREAPVIGNGG